MPHRNSLMEGLIDKTRSVHHSGFLDIQIYEKIKKHLLVRHPSDN